MKKVLAFVILFIMPTLAVAQTSPTVDSNGVPVGTILAFAGPEATIPAGFKLCNGEPYDQNGYGELWKAISNYWGEDQTGKPLLPDLRGMFLRGVNGQRNDAYADSDMTSRETRNGSTYGKNQVGSFQPDMFKAHNHKLDYASLDAPGNATSGDYLPTNETDRPNHHQKEGTDGRRLYDGGKETRPKNAYVNYIIKVGYINQSKKK